MPIFKPLDQERVTELTSRRTGSGVVDLTDQKAWIAVAIQNGSGWGEISLEPSDNVRAIKRRTTIAGKEMQRVVKWHRKSTPENLIFQVIDPGTAAAKRTRRTRAKAEPTAE